MLMTAPSSGKVCSLLAGAVHSELMPTDAIINSERCLEMMQKLIASRHIPIVGPNMQHVFLQHCSARPHTRAQTTTKILHLDDVVFLIYDAV
jgi:hypothetical protein